MAFKGAIHCHMLSLLVRGDVIQTVKREVALKEAV